jgi:Protein of unknown function, DUF481
MPIAVKIHLTLLACIAFSLFGHAQTDSTAKVSKWQLSGDLGLDVSLQSGNLQSSSIVGQFSPTLESSNVTISSFVQYMYSRYDQTVYQNDVLSELSADIWYKRRFFPNVSGRFEATTLRAIKDRIGIGPGIAWRAFKTPKSDLVVLNSVYYYRTTFNLARELSFEKFLYVLTLKGTYATLGDKLNISHDLQYIPWVRREKTNHILRAILSFGLPISDQFAVNIDVDYIYESLVVRNRKNSNLTTAFGIAYAF